jgi:hypothetical protein
MQAWGSGPAMPPQNYVVPNVTFAEPYTQYPQPQQSMAIIGGYAARNMQNVAAIQSNAVQLGEGNANITYELGHLHLVPPDQFFGGDVQTYYEQGYNYQDYQHQPLAEDKEEGGASVFFSFPFFCIFSACVCLCLRSVFSFYLNFSKCVSLFSACMLVCFHHE